MRLVALMLVGVAALAAPEAASAATVVVFADPMTLEKRTVVVKPDGPDKAYLCMLPPSVAGCQEVPVKRVRR